MNISDYLTNHLNLSQAQVEAIDKLAKICGMKSLFEAINFASRVNKVNAKRANNLNNQAADSLVADVDWNLDNGTKFNELYQQRRGASSQASEEDDDDPNDITAELGEHNLNDNNTLFYGLTSNLDRDSTADDYGDYDLGGMSNAGLNDVRETMSASVDANEREDLMDVIKLLSLAAKASVADTKKLMIAAAASLDDGADSTVGSEYDAGIDSVVSANDVSEKVKDLAAQAVEKQDFRLQAKMEEFASKYPKNPFSKIFLADNVRASHRSDAVGTESNAVNKLHQTYNPMAWNRTKALAKAARDRVNARMQSGSNMYNADLARARQLQEEGKLKI